MDKVAIIGFGSAGYNGAKEVRKRSPEAVIDIYSDTGLGPYNPMLTTYYVKNAIPYDALFPFGTLEGICRDLNLNYHMNQPVTGMIPEEKILCFADDSHVRYDRILISTGASAVMPPIPGLNLSGVFKMRTVQDAVCLKEKLESGTVKRGIVIGASWVGIKIVENMVERNIHCTLVDGADWMFYTAAFEETAKRTQRDLEAKGVGVHCGQMLSHIEEGEDGQLTAVMQSGRRFTADIVAVCIGVRMNVGFLRESGLALNRGVLVDRRMETNYEGIYAAGDCCEAYDIQSNTQRSIGLWFNAVEQGKVAGANMAGGHMEFGANVLVNLAHYLDYDFISIGDVSSCCRQDEVYEYEDCRYYIRAIRNGKSIKCMNIIGSSDSNGIVKNAFIKSIENPEAGLSIQTICYLKDKGFPNDFINFLGGRCLD